MANPWEVINESSDNSEGWNVVSEDTSKQSGWEVASETPTSIRAPVVEVVQKREDPFDAKMEEVRKKLTPPSSANPAGIASLVDVGLGLPGFITQAVGQLGHYVVQGSLTGKRPDAAKSRAFGEKLAQSLSLLPEPGEVMPGEYLSKKIGLQKEYKESIPVKAMDALSEAIDLTASALSSTGAVSKDEAKIAIDTAMVLSPYVRLKKKASPYKTMDSRDATTATGPTPGRPYTPVTTKVTESGVTVPKVTVDADHFSNSLTNLKTLNQLDVSETVNQGKLLEKMGVSLDLQEKFRRFDEGQAKGNELIDNKIFDLNESIYDLRASNLDLFAGKTFRNLPEETKVRVKENYDAIDNLKIEIDDLVSKRNTKETLSPIESSIYSRFYLPLRAEIKSLSSELMSKGEMQPHKLTEEFAPRKGAPAKKTAWQATKEAIIGKDYTEDLQSSGTSYVTNAAKERGFYVLEDPATKSRTTISISDPTPRGEVFINFHKNKKKGEPLIVPESVVRASLEGDVPFLGKNLKEATKDEIELNIGPKYVSNYQAVLGVRRAEIRDQLRHTEWVNELLSNPKFKEIGVKISDMPKWEGIPEGFRTLKYADKMPQLRDYAFENRFAEMLDDYNKPTTTNPVIRATNTLVTNMMLIPIAHMHNEGAHWGISRGLSGFVNPLKVKDMLKDFPEAYSEVINRGPLFQQILKEGGSIMSANVRNSSYIEKAFKQSSDVLLKTPSFMELASKLGRTPADLYAGWSKKSNEAMWTVRDILYTQLVMEKMRRENSSVREAITSVERHMPNYRLNSRIGETLLGAKLSRGLSKGLGNKNLFLFSRYHQGLVNSALNTLKDSLMLTKDIKKSVQFREGIDSALAVYVAMAVVYPLVFDQMAQVVSQVFDGDNKVAEAKVRRAGFLHILDTIKEVSESKKDAYSLASSLMTLNPILQMGIELAFNYELYNRKELINWQDPSLTILKDYKDYMLKKIPQFSQGVQATNEDYGTGLAGVVLRNFFDIRTKTDEQIQREERMVQRKEKEAWNRQFEE